jgi:hypothetical protein
MEEQKNRSGTSIMKDIGDSIIPMLSALLIFMLLIDWAFSPFMNKPIQINTRSVSYEKAYERADQPIVLTEEQSAMELGLEACKGIYEFQTEQHNPQGTTTVTLVPVRKIFD